MRKKSATIKKRNWIAIEDSIMEWFQLKGIVRGFPEQLKF